MNFLHLFFIVSLACLVVLPKVDAQELFDVTGHWLKELIPSLENMIVDQATEGIEKLEKAFDVSFKFAMNLFVPVITFATTSTIKATKTTTSESTQPVETTTAIPVTTNTVRSTTTTLKPSVCNTFKDILDSNGTYIKTSCIIGDAVTKDAAASLCKADGKVLYILATASDNTILPYLKDQFEFELFWVMKVQPSVQIITSSQEPRQIVDKNGNATHYPLCEYRKSK